MFSFSDLKNREMIGDIINKNTTYDRLICDICPNMVDCSVRSSGDSSWMIYNRIKTFTEHLVLGLRYSKNLLLASIKAFGDLYMVPIVNFLLPK